jgi:hypothetical protein
MKEKRDHKNAKAKTVQPSPFLPSRIHQTELIDSVNTVGVQQPFIANGPARYPVRLLQAILRLMAEEDLSSRALNVQKVKK